MDFVDDRSAKAVAKGRTDAATKARHEREKRRIAQEQRGTAEQIAAQERAARKLQPTMRKHIALLRSRGLQREEWDAALASAGATPLAGQQLALCSWLLRFFEPGHDDERLRAFSRVTVDARLA